MRIGPLRNGLPWLHSVLWGPVVVSHKALSRASPTMPIDGRSPASIGCLAEIYCSILTSGVAMMNSSAKRVT